MSIIKYKVPFSNLVQRDEFLAPFDRFFDEFFKINVPEFTQEFGSDFFANGSYPKVDIINYADKVVVEAEVPGLTKNDIHVEVINDLLVISGVKQKTDNVEKNGGKIVHKELKHSSFRRSFTLTNNINKDEIDAKFENGVLTITLLKLKPINDTSTQTKKIEIK